MKTTCTRYLIAAVLVCLGGKAIAQESGKLAPLPDTLPSSVEARVGHVDFEKGLPTQKGIEQLFEIQDFQRAVQNGFRIGAYVGGWLSKGSIAK